MLALRCPSADVLAAGALKELRDILGPGNAEVDDLAADIMGITIADRRAARSDEQCLSQCDLYFIP